MNVFGARGHITGILDERADVVSNFHVDINMQDLIGLMATGPALLIEFALSGGNADNVSFENTNGVVASGALSFAQGAGMDQATFDELERGYGDNVGINDDDTQSRPAPAPRLIRQFFTFEDLNSAVESFIIPSYATGFLRANLRIHAYHNDAQLTVRLISFDPVTGQAREPVILAQSNLVRGVASGVTISSYGDPVQFDIAARIGRIEITERSPGQLTGGAAPNSAGEVSVLLRAPRGYTWGIRSIGPLGGGGLQLSSANGAIVVGAGSLP